MIPKLGKVQRIDVRSAWMNEASHFTPWLASEEGMELLQETLDMELEVEATEKFVGPFKADILAKRTDTTDDHWVLIENQLERTDHRHLGQLLTYAAGLDAVTIVWIAENFAEEHRAALDWLNDVTGEGLELFGLEIELWQIEGSPPAPMFNIVAQPNDWAREVKQGAKAQVTDLKEQQGRFWQALKAQLKEEGSKLTPRKARPQHWFDFSIGKTDTWLTATINSQEKRLSVEFNFRGPPGKLWFEQLTAHKHVIDESIPGLDWQRLEGKKQSRIALYKDGDDPTVENDWPKQQQWLIKNLELFREVVQPYLTIFASHAPAGTESDLTEPEGAEVA